MDMATYERETEINRKAYEQLKQQIQTEHAGKYIALGSGRILAVAPTYDEVEAALEKLQDLPESYFVFPAEMEPHFELVCDYYMPPLNTHPKTSGA
jgi:hypothetical protein